MTETLERFLQAQTRDYEIALREIKAGHKKSHWIWYIFPQLKGLGRSHNSEYYGIKDSKEARAYLEHPVLGKRLLEITEALLQLPEADPLIVMGSPDDIKLQSCMTLFALVLGDKDSVFYKVLDKFFGGQLDQNTKARITD